jgi:hypothetical protein
LTLLASLKRAVVDQARALPLARRAHAALRKRKYEQTVGRFIKDGTGRADPLPMGLVYEATMRCNLTCEFCYVGDLLNIEGEWREELPLDALRRAFPEGRLQVNLTGGEIFMRKDILSVLDVFREKGYTCGYLTTNGTIISDERADALAELARLGFLTHVSVSIDGPGELHDKARGEGHVPATSGGPRRLQASAKKARRRASASTPPSPSEPDTRAGWSTSPSWRRRHRAQSPDVRHRRRARRDAIIGTDPKIISTTSPRIPASIRPASARRSGDCNRPAPARACCSTTAPRSTRRSSIPTTHRALPSPAAASTRSCTRGCRSAARCSSVRSSASRSAT